MFDHSTAGAMSAELFAVLGENRLAYIKAIRSEEVAFLCAEAPLLAAGQQVFVLHAADGTPILLTDTREFGDPRTRRAMPHRNRSAYTEAYRSC